MRRQISTATRTPPAMPRTSAASVIDRCVDIRTSHLGNNAAGDAAIDRVIEQLTASGEHRIAGIVARHFAGGFRRWVR